MDYDPEVTVNTEIFLRLVRSEPEREVLRKVVVDVGSVRSGMPLLSLPTGPVKTISRRYRHIIDAPAKAETVKDWTKRNATELPADLIELLFAMNGIHLWASADTGRSYAGIAPIEEWELARTKMFGPEADSSLLADGYIAISYHADGGAYVVLQPSTSSYFLMDPSGPDESVLIGRTVDSLLDWVWSQRIEPRSLA